MQKKILILFGHPDHEGNRTITGQLTDAYEQGARAGGHEVHRINLADLHFDPILHEGYRTIQQLEPDLLHVQEEMKWADHLVVFYPNWWSSMPALLKGMFDRMILPGFAFRYFKEGMFHDLMWHRMLRGRSAHVFITLGAHPLVERFIVGDYTNELRRGILWFVGYHPIRLSTIGPTNNASTSRIERWKRNVYRLGQRGR